jgi:hypothetical protein
MVDVQQLRKIEKNSIENFLSPPNSQGPAPDLTRYHMVNHSKLNTVCLLSRKHTAALSLHPNPFFFKI